MTNYWLGLDAGTTSIKAALFDDQGQCLGISREEYQLITPSPEQAELEPEIYWLSSLRAVQSAIQKAGVNPRQVKAITVSSQGETVIALNQAGEPLRPALVWLDNRAVPQAEWLASHFDPGTVYEITGIPGIVPNWSACKIRWIRENEPVLFDRVYKYTLVQDYLIYRLTGEYITDGSVSCTTLYYDLRRHQWWPEMLEAVGISPAQLPRITQPGESNGCLTPQAAEEMGLATQTQVVNGGMDQAAGAVGAGNVHPNMVSETTGAAMAIQATISEPSRGGKYNLPVCVHSVAGFYLIEPYLPTGGMALKWFRDVFGERETQMVAGTTADAYDLLAQLAAGVPPGCEGLVMLPHLMGAFSPEENPAARGVFSGFTLEHGKGHFVRAILEGVAFNLRQILAALNQAGYQFSEVRTSGGGSRSSLWNQIKADVCGLPIVTLNNEETALLGDAILAGVACGVFSSVAEACGQMVSLKERILPGEQRVAYEKAYQRYSDLNQCLGQYFRSNYSG